MKNENNREQIVEESFSEWLSHTRRSFITEEGISVECGDCRACCTSSYFIHIHAGEINTLSKIPGKLLFPAPGSSKEISILGYDKKGHCPMFKHNSCSIYNDRPRTCRNFDCRVFAATGIFEDEEKSLINRQAKRWKFTISGKKDHDSITALLMTAGFIVNNPDRFPRGFIPKNSVQKAALVIKVYEVFIPFINYPGPVESADMKDKFAELIMNAYKIFENEKP